MTAFHQVSIELEVDDPQELLSAAIVRAQADGLTREDAVELLTYDGEPHITNCLVMLLDPGTLPGVSIIQSSAE